MLVLHFDELGLLPLDIELPFLDFLPHALYFFLPPFRGFLQALNFLIAIVKLKLKR